MRVTKVCKHCGSDDVMLDANAEWDNENQEWVLRSTFDDPFCGNCEGETTIIDKPID